MRRVAESTPNIVAYPGQYCTGTGTGLAFSQSSDSIRPPGPDPRAKPAKPQNQPQPLLLIPSLGISSTGPYIDFPHAVSDSHPVASTPHGQIGGSHGQRGVDGWDLESILHFSDSNLCSHIYTYADALCANA